MTRMTIDIPDVEYKKLKISAINFDMSIKDYVLDAIRLKEKILIRDDGKIRVLNKETISALEQSRKSSFLKKTKKFDSVEKLFKVLDSKPTKKLTKKS